MAGYYALVFEFVIEIVLTLLGPIVILTVGHISNWNPNGGQSSGMIFFAVWSAFWLFLTICSTIVWGRRLLPFFKKEGQVMKVKIRERTYLGGMYGEAEIEGENVPVKIHFSSIGQSHFYLYSDGEYVRCFVKNEDLPKPRAVVMYKSL